MLRTAILATIVFSGANLFAAEPVLPTVAGQYECTMRGTSMKPQIEITETDGLLFFDGYFAGFLTQLGNNGLACETLKGKPVVAADGSSTTVTKTCNAKVISHALKYVDTKKKAWLASVLIKVVNATKISITFQDFPADQNGKTFQMPKMTWPCTRK